MIRVPDMDDPSLAQALLATAREALVAVAPDGRIVAWSWGAETLFGHKAADALGRDLVELVAPPEEAPRARAAIQEALDTGTAQDQGLRRAKDGRALVVSMFARSVPGPDGAPRWVALSHRDLTAHRRLQEQLSQQNRELGVAKEVAEGAAKAKAEFLATMSHEIRTPMNAVIGMTSLLHDTKLDAEQREFVEIIRTSGEHLLTIINDILDYSKIESSRIELERVPFSLRACLEEALDLAAPRAAEKHLDLAYFIEEGVPEGFLGDPGRLRQVLLNLLGNAVKFTDKGEVFVWVASSPAGGRLHEIHIAVKDTGPGIPHDRQARLFKPFSQADASTTRTHGGTGLGLAISRRLCELMGGTIWVQSEVKVGSIFHVIVRLPEAAAPEPSEQGPVAELAGRRVLVVDDNATNRRIVSTYVSSWGMVPTEAAGGPEALAKVDAGEAFDLVLLDFQMPGMDGLSLARALRERPSMEGKPLVILSSMGGRRTLGEASAEVDGFLTKPIKPSALYNVVASVLGRGPARSAAPDAARRGPALGRQRPLRLLLVEDNPMNQKVATRLLERLGYRCDLAADGQQALDAVGRSTYDVVLMDVQMPVLDGLEATRRIRAAPLPGPQPWIIAMTANALAEDRRACAEAGMDDYLPKPVSLEALAEALTRAKPRGVQASPGDPSASRPSPPAPAAEASAASDGARAPTAAAAARDPESPEPLRLDAEALAALERDMGAGTALEILASYAEEGAELVEALATRLEAGDPKALERPAHTLKSMSAMVGALDLAATCKALEERARAGDLPAAAPLAERAVAAWRLVGPAVAQEMERRRAERAPA